MSEVFAFVEFVEQRPQLLARLRVRFIDDLVNDRIPRVADFRTPARRDGDPAVRTKVAVRGDGSPTVATGLADPIGTVLAFDDAGLAEDVGVVFLRRDVLVNLPHVGVERPVYAVFDLRPRVALADHPSDSSVPEGVGRNALVQVGVRGDALELLAGGVGPQRAVIVAPSVRPFAAVRLELVKQRDVRVVRPRVRPAEIRPQRRDRVDQRVLRDRRTFEPVGVAVGRVRGLVAKIDVLDPERQCQREARPGVGEELDKGDVAVVTRRGRERLDVFRGEHIVGFDAGIVDAGPLNGRGPLGVSHVADEQQHAVLVAFDRRVREVVVVAQRPDEVVIVALAHVHERDVGTFAGDADAPEVGLERSGRDTTVLALDPLFNRRPIGVMDSLGVEQTVVFVGEPSGEVLGVVDGHTGPSKAGYYKLPVGESTSSISYGLVKTPGKPPQTAGYSTFRDTKSSEPPLVPRPRSVEEESRTKPAPTDVEAGGTTETAGRDGDAAPSPVVSESVEAFNTTTYWYQSDYTTTTTLTQRDERGTNVVPPAAAVEPQGGVA